MESLLKADNLDEFLSLATEVGTPGFIIRVLRSHSRQGEEVCRAFDMRLCESQAEEAIDRWAMLNKSFSYRAHEERADPSFMRMSSSPARP